MEEKRQGEGSKKQGGASMSTKYGVRLCSRKIVGRPNRHGGVVN